MCLPTSRRDHSSPPLALLAPGSRRKCGVRSLQLCSLVIVRRPHKRQRQGPATHDGSIRSRPAS
eukprot:2322958-Prymnesium_polylepis.2